MATGFDPDGGTFVPFNVDMSSGGTLLPLPEISDDRTRSWEADILIADGTDAAALRREQVSITVRPAVGMMDGGTIILEGKNAGGDTGRFGNLIIPTDMDGSVQTWRAALASCSLGAEALADLRRSSVRFVLGSRVS